MSLSVSGVGFAFYTALAAICVSGGVWWHLLSSEFSWYPSRKCLVNQLVVAGAVG